MKNNQIIPLPNGTDLAVVESKELLDVSDKDLKKGRRKNKPKKGQESQVGSFDGFPDLACLMNMTVAELKEEFFLFQVRKLMSKMAKTIVRFGVSDREMEKLFFNAKQLQMDQVVVAPAFLPACEKQVAKLGEDGFKVGVIVDFPFGESSFKNKLSSIKECIKKGVDDVTVMMPTLLINKDHSKEFKKQSAKIGKIYKGCAGIALNATDLNEEQIKLAVKSVNKTKLAFITFVFGTASLEEVKAKMAIVKKYKDNKKVFALANVDTAEGVMALFSNGVDKILTPYADQIGEQLIDRFRVKSVKLK